MIDENSTTSANGGAILWGELLPPSVERTFPPYPADVSPSDGSWQIVNGSRFKFFVFSAYYERRGGKLIRVIGATKTRGPEKVWCRLWYPIGPNNSTHRSSSVMARVKIIRENWNLNYSACFVLCPLDAPGLEISLEFLEMYSLLGVSHFTFYNNTLGPKADCVLRHYMEESLASANSPTQDGTVQRPTISILPWDLKMESQKEIRTEGLFAASNDCLYRSMYRFQHVALVDSDEFIIPRRNDTLKELLEWLSLKGSNTGAYSFQNAFFYLQFPDDILMYERDVSNPALRGVLITQRKTQRRSELHPNRQRSKYICKPESVVEAGNHFVWEYLPGRGPLNVPSDAAILHHYRVCEYGGDDCVKAPSTVDRTAHKYSRRLTDRVEMMYNKLKTACKLFDLPTVPTRGPENLKIKNIAKTDQRI